MKFLIVAASLLASVFAEKKCYTFVVSGDVEIESSPIPIVNPVPAREAFNSTEFPVKSCEHFFRTYNAFSCRNKTEIPESEKCCFENIGIILLAQFWDYNPKILLAVNGSKPNTLDSIKWSENGSATLHGLWSDYCNGSYPQYCNFSDPITADQIPTILENANETNLLPWMKSNWVNTANSNVQNGGSETLWEHEYNKHGTCMNTITPDCFNGEITPGQNVALYYKKASELHRQLPTADFLAKEGIVPTPYKQYAKSDIEAALRKWHANTDVYIGCVSGALSEIWYYHHLRGNLLTGDFRPIDSTAPSKTCPDKIWYLPK